MNYPTEHSMHIYKTTPSDWQGGALLNSIATPHPTWLQQVALVYNTIEGIEHRPYQVDFAALYCSTPNNLCAGGLGLGKTIITALTIAAIYFTNPKQVPRPGTVHIIVPSALSANSRWLVDLNKIPLLRGQAEFINNDRALFRSTAPIWVYTMDFLKRKSLIRKYNTKPFVSRIVGRRFSPSYLVIDEVHNLKPGSVRSKHIEYVRRKAKRVLALSGTLSDGRLELIYHIAKLVYRNDFPFNKQQFSTFSAKVRSRTHYLRGSEDVLESQLRYLPHLGVDKAPLYYKQVALPFIHRVSMVQPDVACCASLPKVEYVTKTVQPSQVHKRLYDEAANPALIESIAHYATEHARVFSLLNPLQVAANAPWEHQVGLEHNLKLQALLTLLSSPLAEEGKVAVFSNLICVGNHLARSLLSDSTVRLYASDSQATPSTLSARARQEVLDRFQYDPLIKVGVFSYIAGESIDLTAARTLVFYDYPWQALKYIQAVSRAVRPGNPHPKVTVVSLINKGFIDEHMHSLIKQKDGSASALLDFDFGTQYQPRTIHSQQLLTLLRSTPIDH